MNISSLRNNTPVMDEILGTKHDATYADLKHFEKVLLESTTGKRAAASDIRKSYEVLLYRACSLGLTDILASLVAHLDSITSLEYCGIAFGENFRSSILYDCLSLAAENNHDHVIRILLELVDSHTTDATPLHCAAANGDVGIAAMLITKSRIDVDHRNSLDETALHFACNAAIAGVLLSYGAGVDAMNSRSETPLYYACANYRLGVIRRLLEHGAKPNLGSSFVPPNVACDWDDDSKIAEVLLALKPIQCPYTLCIQPSCVWIAIKSILAENGNPLCETCKRENQPIIERILAKKAGVHMKSTVDNPPLHLAISNFHKEKVETAVADMEPIQMILSKSDPDIVNAPNRFGTTPLYLAVVRNLIEVATLLLDLGADPNRTTSDRYPLIVACRYLPYEFVRLLLHRGADPNVADCYATSPLCIAAESLDHRLVQLLVEHGADVNHRDQDGRTALHCVIDTSRTCPLPGVSRVEIVEYLLDNGSALDHTSAMGKTVLSDAIYHMLFLHMRRRFARVSVRFALFELLLERGADVNHADRNNANVLCRATQMQCCYAVRELLRHGGNLNVFDTHGRSLLSISCANNDIQSTHILLAAGADPNILEWNMLARVSAINNIELIDLLLSNGAKFNVPTTEVNVFCGKKLPEVAITLRDFLVPFCEETDCTVRLFKAGADLKTLATCCGYKRKRPSLTPWIECPLGGRLCQAMVLAGHNLQHQQLVEMLRQSERRHDRDLVSWLEEESSTAPSLSRLSRTTIRRQLSAASGCRSILPLIDILPTPNQIRMYLRFEGPLSEIDLTVHDAENISCAFCSG